MNATDICMQDQKCYGFTVFPKHQQCLIIAVMQVLSYSYESLAYLSLASQIIHL